MTRPPYTDHVLARIVALLLSLATSAERAASRSLALRLFMLSTLLPAHNAMLVFLAIPTDAGCDACEQTPAPPGIDLTSKDLLLQLAARLRAVAALVAHIALKASGPEPHAPREAVALAPGVAMRPTPGRFLDLIGVSHDTS